MNRRSALLGGLALSLTLGLRRFYPAEAQPEVEEERLPGEHLGIGGDSGTYVSYRYYVYIGDRWVSCNTPEEATAVYATLLA